jgi:HSP20 family protein
VIRQSFSSYLELMHLQSEMNKLFEALQDVSDTEERPEIGYKPPYDIIETPEELLVEIDMPGIMRESLKIQSRGGNLIVAGERKAPTREEMTACHLVERDRGRFTRRIHVEGAFNSRQATATYRLGVLAIKLPRVQDRRGTLVDIPLVPEE